MERVMKEAADMKRVFHLCFSSGNEVMFRNREDVRVFTNARALALFRTKTELFVDAMMSNHVHMSILTDDPQAFAKNLRLRYAMYFNHRYHREGKLGDPAVFLSEIVGQRHILTACS